MKSLLITAAILAATILYLLQQSPTSIDCSSDNFHAPVTQTNKLAHCKISRAHDAAEWMNTLISNLKG